MKKVYNKLVRDRIPEIIEAGGGECKSRVLTEEEYINALDKKLSEELSEYLENRSLEELADLTEVIYSLAVALGYTPGQLEQLRLKKADERGGFENRIFLIEVEK